VKNKIIYLALAALCIAGLSSAQAAQKPSSQKEQVTVPLYVEFNRPFIDLEFTRPDGSTRKARFWVDTGGGGFILTEPLAKELNLKLGEVFDSEDGGKIARIDPPQVSLGGMPLDLKDARALVAIGAKTFMPGVNAEGLFPAHILRRYHVIFDYPGRKFTLAKPGSLKPRGIQLSSPIGRTGFPRIEATIGGETFGFLLDTGASFTMISQELLNKWANQHADWPRATGAVGAANMGLVAVEAKGLQLRIPDFQLATFKLEGIGAIARPKGTFENYMTRMMTSPIMGAIGGNVLSAFRIEIDYANGVTYLEKKASPDKNDADMVGLTLSAQPDGSYIVVAVSSQNPKDVIDRIQAKDKLIRVDRLEVTGAPLAKVVDSLRGKPKEKRTLILERDGKSFTVVATVVRIL
ncbi:MAG TPA: aspartyl protease family protein, partial [Blastocatellia bacterium]